MNPLLTADNPGPILGCHAPEGSSTQWCGYLDFTYRHTGSPCVMTTEVLDIRPGFSHPLMCSYYQSKRLVNIHAPMESLQGI
jgi:hypothetical protein